MAYERVYGTGGKSSVLLEPGTAKRVRHVVRRMEEHGRQLILLEGLRPVGEPGDQWVTNERQTSTGGSTQWYQWGRYRRGETPSAAYPGESRHGSGRAIDWNAPSDTDMAYRARFMREAGMVANVDSESWHAEPLGPVLVDLEDHGPFDALTPAERRELLDRLRRVDTATDNSLAVLTRLDRQRWREEQQPTVREAVRAELAQVEVDRDRIADRIVRRLSR